MPTLSSLALEAKLVRDQEYYADWTYNYTDCRWAQIPDPSIGWLVPLFDACIILYCLYFAEIDEFDSAIKSGAEQSTLTVVALLCKCEYPDWPVVMVVPSPAGLLGQQAQGKGKDSDGTTPQPPMITACRWLEIRDPRIG